MASKLLLTLSLLLLTLTLHTFGTTALAKRTNPNPNPPPNPIPTTTEFIKSSCKATRYPAACVQTLSGYASAIRQSEQQLAVTALSVSVSKTLSCASFVKRMGSVKGMKPREYNALRDCVENMNDSVDRLNQSVKELGLVGMGMGMGKGKGKGKAKDFAWHVSNVQTWVSAAITDQDTCLDGFDGPHVDANLRASVRPRVVEASQVTSNALALFNRFASKYRSP